MVGKRKSQPETPPSASAAEESDSGSPARKKQRNGHANGHTNGDASDEEMEEPLEVKPEGANGSQATNGVQEENGDDDGSDEEEEKDYIEENNEEGEIIRRPKRRIVKIERGADGYVAGSIVRVKLDNFVTYDHVEFRPGAQLNMIIGPNGTGKSTIVCAITLGLGWPPKILGRAPEISAFVKQGCKKAYTEIELKGRAGRYNVIIKREFNRDDKKSIWFMNGERTTGQKVSNVVSDLGIQIGNLCAFLPQDKVAEFAQMNPRELLKATMEAAGDPNLTSWHNILVNNAGKLETYQQELQTQQSRQQDLNRRIDDLNEDVENFLQRQALIAKVKEEEVMKLVRDFRVKTAEKQKYKTTWKRYQRQYQEHINRAAPCIEVKNRESQKKARLTDHQNALRTSHKKALAAIEQVEGRLDGKATETEGIIQDLANLRDKEIERKQQIASNKSSIEKLKTATENRPANVDTTELDKEINVVRHKKRALQEEQKTLDRKFQASNEKGSQINNNLDQIQNQLAVIQNIRKQRIQALGRANQSCGYAMQWIERNADKFKQEIVFPAAVSVQVSDPSFAHLVELACGNNLQTFVAQNEDDYRVLNTLNDSQHFINGRQRVRINTIQITQEDIQSETPYPAPREQLEASGMEGFALDFCDCPPAMRAFLRNSGGLHMTAISRETGDNIDEKAAQACGVSRLLYAGDQYKANPAAWDDLRAPHHIEMSNIRTSKYGSRARQITSNQTRFEARYFNQNVDDDEVERLNRQRASFAEQRSQLEAEIQRLSLSAKASRPEQEKLQKLEEELNTRKSVIVAEVRRFERAKMDLQKAKLKLEALLNQPSMEDMRTQLKGTLMIHVKERVKLAQKLTSLCVQANKLAGELAEAQMDIMQIDANTDAIDDHVRGFAAQQEELEADLERSKAAYQTHRRITEAAAAAATKQVNTLDLDLRTELSARWEHDERSVNEIDQVIQQAKNDIELLPEVNRSAVDRLERYKSELLVVEHSVKKHKMKVDKLGMTVKKTHDKFDGALTDLVTMVSAKFGAALKRNSCAGEVRLVRTGEDYANWALEILVKFRDAEELQVLTAQRQSGGERSLTTIMYLTSLTELSRTPFSLVDEINQGMDQRAERIVHDQLVEVTCREDAGQYFLITPKLLTNLRYDQKMSVLCIYNGEYLPENEYKLGDVKNLLANIRSKMAEA